MNSSSEWLIRRDVPKQNSSSNLTTDNLERFTLFVSRVLLTIFRYLATSAMWMRRLSGLGECKRRLVNPETITSEKEEFLEKFVDDYGYPDGPTSIDELRAKEFTRLRGTIYLDHAGATLYTETQLKEALSDLSTHLYGNPHSQSDSSTLSSDAVEHARCQVLAMCNASNEDYTCVFTSGATAALKLVGETFPWSSNSQYMYTMENHNSVLGIREYALCKGATATPVDIEYNRYESSGEVGISKSYSGVIRQRSHQRRDVTMIQAQECLDEQVYNLFACPLECNFSGAKVDLGLVPFVQQAHHVDSQRGKWLVLLDAAKGCGTAPPNLSSFPADFVAVSFYKIFGYPTGLGALLIRKDAAKLLKKTYFGGGTVAVSIADTDFMKRREKVEQWLEDGTSSFLDIAALHHGFQVINKLQMSAISRHTGSLASYTASKLTGLKHMNGRRVCMLYGNHGRKNLRYWGPLSEQGPIVAFNMKRADGSWIGCREVEKLATLSNIHLRTGCFCNPGACAKNLGLSTNEMKANFEAGHVCWDDKDLINGRPTGAVRVSFGYMNIFEDCWAFLQFILKFFVEDNAIKPSLKESNEGSLLTLISADEPSSTEEQSVSLQSITVYPIKSCAGFTTNVWTLGDCGLLYDREWVLLSTTGEVLTQKKCPAMCFIQPHIDLESGVLHVQAPNVKEGLTIRLTELTECKLSGDVWLCGDTVGAKSSEAHASEWFTKTLGIPCKLVRKEAKSSNGAEDIGSGGRNGRNFANEGQFLLVSQESVDDLNLRLASLSSNGDGQDRPSISGQSSIQVDASRFRPNFVVSGSIPYDEDNWETLSIGDQQLKVLGGCNRCKMINIDQITGEREAFSEPLVTLASYRRVKGRIYFGLLLERDRGAVPLPSKQTRPGDEQETTGKEAALASFLKRRYTRVVKVGQRVHVSKRIGFCNTQLER